MFNLDFRGTSFKSKNLKSFYKTNHVISEEIGVPRRKFYYFRCLHKPYEENEGLFKRWTDKKI